MLESVLRYLNNRFEKDSLFGRFTVKDGRLDIEPAMHGQFFWVEGSVFNDGLHRYPAETMRDETFTGRVTMLAVPSVVVELADEIEGWLSENGDALKSPYKSESFGGYSYSKEDGDGGALGWQSHFASRLRPFRKLSRRW